MNTFKKVNGIISISGDYCAFHEMSCSVIYVYGYGECGYSDTMCEHYTEYMNIDFGDDDVEEVAYQSFKKLTIDELDKVADDFINTWKYDADYSDYQKTKIIIEVNDSDKIVNSYYNF